MTSGATASEKVHSDTGRPCSYKVATYLALKSRSNPLQCLAQKHGN